jgi:hypothetical protein
VDVSPEVQNTQDIIHRSYEAQEEGRPKCGFLRRGNKIPMGGETETKSASSSTGFPRLWGEI